ncbi:MAG: M48 family metallopeptidase [Bacteroidota bacterium]|nr:M48 family metallopeptidase [Bacteroidota bacterium]
MKTFIQAFIFVVLLVTINGCKKDGGNSSINIFTIDDDKKLGLQVSQQIESDPKTYPLLNESQYTTSYTYIRKIVTNILNSGKVYYKDQFVWQTKIIKNDSVLNAFCTPGGYIYVYTGLIKFLDSEDKLAGVLAHEIAHADRRHATNQMTKAYGLTTLIEVVLGKNPGLLASIANNLLTLEFSREDEAEADKYSVIYLCPTQYNADGAAAFFQKLISSGQGTNTPAFLSTHPSPDNRIKNIENEKTTLGCTGNQTYTTEYANFVKTLP